MAELKQRNLDEVKALSRDEAVEIMRQAGIVGAGGGGFPTYFKWKNPQPNLIVNCTESEPGYWADKVLHRDYFDEFLELFDVMKTIFGIEERHHGCPLQGRGVVLALRRERRRPLRGRPRAGQVLDGRGEDAHQEHLQRGQGQVGAAPGGAARRQQAPGLPLDAGHVVNNSETLLNIYNAFFFGKPVTTKYLQVFGPDLELKLFEVAARVVRHGAALARRRGRRGRGRQPLRHRRRAVPERDGHRVARRGRRLRAAHHQRLPRHPQGRRLQGVRGDQDQAARGRHLARRQGRAA